MQTLREIKEMLGERGLAPNKRLGQNFLIDHNLLRNLVAESQVGPGDLVLEIGPGTGTLTEAILAQGCRVVACELDAGLADLLSDRLAAKAGDFKLIRGDCLKTKRILNPEVHAAIAGQPFTLVANLPYGAATPLIMTLLLQYPHCQRMCVTIQHEVADRIGASAGSGAYGEISVITGALAEVHHIADLAPECFWPRPKVRSAMIRIERRAQPLTDDTDSLEKLCRLLFGQRRKQIGALLGRDRPFPTGIAPTDRVEALSPDQIITLAAWAAQSEGSGDR